MRPDVKSNGLKVWKDLGLTFCPFVLRRYYAQTQHVNLDCGYAVQANAQCGFLVQDKSTDWADTFRRPLADEESGQDLRVRLLVFGKHAPDAQGLGHTPGLRDTASRVMWRATVQYCGDGP